MYPGYVQKIGADGGPRHAIWPTELMDEGMGIWDTTPSYAVGTQVFEFPYLVRNINVISGMQGYYNNVLVYFCNLNSLPISDLACQIRLTGSLDRVNWYEIGLSSVLPAKASDCYSFVYNNISPVKYVFANSYLPGIVGNTYYFPVVPPMVGGASNYVNTQNQYGPQNLMIVGTT